MRGTALATGVLPHNGKRSNHLLLIWRTPKAWVASSNPLRGAMFDCFVLYVTTRATVQGRAGFGLRGDPPAFPGERGRFTRLNDEGSGRLREMAASICRRRPGFSSLQRLRSRHNGPLYVLSAISPLSLVCCERQLLTRSDRWRTKKLSSLFRLGRRSLETTEIFEVYRGPLLSRDYVCR